MVTATPNHVEEAYRCPMCGGVGRYVGGLGDLEWYRCRACGVDYTPDEVEVLDPELAAMPGGYMETN